MKNSKTILCGMLLALGTMATMVSCDKKGNEPDNNGNNGNTTQTDKLLPQEISGIVDYTGVVHTFRYVYDDNNRIVSFTEYVSEHIKYSTTIKYDEQGQPKTVEVVEYPSENFVEQAVYTYSNNKVTEVVSFNDGGTHYEDTYIYTLNDKKLPKTQQHGEHIFNLSYDEKGNCVYEFSEDFTSKHEVNCSYDDKNSIFSGVNTPVLWLFDYIGVLLLNTKEKVCWCYTNNPISCSSDNFSYEYNDKNYPTKIFRTESTGPNAKTYELTVTYINAK